MTDLQKQFNAVVRRGGNGILVRSEKFEAHNKQLLMEFAKHIGDTEMRDFAEYVDEFLKERV